MFKLEWFSPERRRPNLQRKAQAPPTAPPDVLATSIDAIRSSQARQRPIVMITCAADGLPWVCVPDWGELRVIEDRCLRVAIWPDDPTVDDLDRGEPVLLVVTGSPDVHLIRATARRLADAAMVWAHYDLTITSARKADRGTVPYTAQLGPGTAARSEILNGAAPR
ncbi:hypothetical protein ACN3XK_62240 [Actinomadura welshii]